MCSRDWSHVVTALHRPPPPRLYIGGPLRGGQFGPGLHQFSSPDGRSGPGRAGQHRERRNDLDGAPPLGPHSQLQRRDRMLPVVIFVMAVAAVPRVHQMQKSHRTLQTAA